MSSEALWRVCFVAAGLLIASGGFTHPRGATMHLMLVDPNWVLSHVLQFVGYGALAAGLVAVRRSGHLGVRSTAAVGLAVIGTVLQISEMAFHTASVIDADALAAGDSTPVLTTHLVLSVIVYPLFAASIIYFIVAGARDRSFGSRATAWLGVVGAAAHGAAPPLVLVLELQWARVLFPCVIFFALWLLITASIPRRIPTHRIESSPSAATGA